MEVMKFVWAVPPDAFRYTDVFSLTYLGFQLLHALRKILTSLALKHRVPNGDIAPETKHLFI